MATTRSYVAISEKLHLGPGGISCPCCVPARFNRSTFKQFCRRVMRRKSRLLTKREYQEHLVDLEQEAWELLEWEANQYALEQESYVNSNSYYDYLYDYEESDRYHYDEWADKNRQEFDDIPREDYI